MGHSSLEAFIEQIRVEWGPLTSEVAAACSRRLAALLETSPSEPWLADLLRERPATEELHRDPTLGFVLLAHTEHAGLYRPPHDHGRSWVIYGVVRGAIEMGGYGRIENACGGVRLVKRGATLVGAGQVQVYLPGDIHDTRCVTPSALLFRFTERDLKTEDRQAGRVTRYVQRDGVWTTGVAQ
jgi:hypothetical protein